MFQLIPLHIYISSFLDYGLQLLASVFQSDWAKYLDHWTELYEWIVKIDRVFVLMLLECKLVILISCTHGALNCWLNSLIIFFIFRNTVGNSDRGTVAVSAPGSSHRFEFCPPLICFKFNVYSLLQFCFYSKFIPY